jgi:hypothetical protein
MFEILGKSSESIGNESLVWQLQLQFQLNLYYNNHCLNEFMFLANTFLNNLFHINIYGYSDITIITNKNIELFAS